MTDKEQQTVSSEEDVQVAKKPEESTPSTDKPEHVEAEEEDVEPSPEDHTEPQTVPYSRFKDVYGALKRTERELEKLRRQPETTSQQQQQSQRTDAVGPKPVADNFDTYEEYIEALTDWKQDQRDAARRQEEQRVRHATLQRQVDEQVSKAIAKDPKFLEKGFIPEGLVPFLEDASNLTDFAYYFGENPHEVHRIFSGDMSPYQIAREIGKLEAGFANKPPQKSQTKAPDPTKPVGSKETPAKNPEDMTTAEWIAMRNKAEGL